jgi:hypothetical protein
MRTLSCDEEFHYLALLTAEGIKPLSRWEIGLDNDQLYSLKRLGLQVSTLARSTEWGRVVTHTIFSRQPSILQQHREAFAGTPLTRARQSVRKEGLDFGYPSCCVQAFVERGYQNNGFSPQDQGILFHWACPGCEQTRRLLPEYRRILSAFVSGMY